MHAWNAEEMSEFYIDLGIISINLVCKSLIMNELPYEEIREKGPWPRLRNSHTYQLGREAWDKGEYEEMAREVERECGYLTVWKTRRERVSEDAIWLFSMAESSPQKTKNWQWIWQNKGYCCFSPEHLFVVSWRRKTNVCERKRKWNWKKQGLCIENVFQRFDHEESLEN